MAGGVTMETMEVRQLSHDGHLPMKSAPESVGYEIWPSHDMILKSWTITSVCTGVHVDLPPGICRCHLQQTGPCPRGNRHCALHSGCKFSGSTELSDAQHG